MVLCIYAVSSLLVSYGCRLYTVNILTMHITVAVTDHNADRLDRAIDRLSLTIRIYSVESNDLYYVISCDHNTAVLLTLLS